METNCNGNYYNKFEATLSACENIVGYLFENASNFWKLLYYNTYDGLPYMKDNLTDEQKRAMICRNPMATPTETVDKNILFQMELDEAFSVAKPQVRFFTGDINAIDSHRGGFEICVQIIVPNKQEIFIAPYSASASRSLAISQELTQALNGVTIPNANFNYKLFMDKSAPNGIGRSTGWYRQKQNKNYAGYYGVFATLI